MHAPSDVPNFARRWRLAVLWAGCCTLLAPATFALAVTAASIVSATLDAGPRARPPLIPTAMYMGVFAYLAAIFFGLAPLVVVLTLWSWAAPRLGALETSALGLAGATALIAVPAGVFMYLSGPRATWTAGALVALATWAGLLLPRLVVVRLRPGALAHAAGQVR